MSSADETASRKKKRYFDQVTSDNPPGESAPVPPKRARKADRAVKPSRVVETLSVSGRVSVLVCGSAEVKVETGVCRVRGFLLKPEFGPLRVDSPPGDPIVEVELASEDGPPATVEITTVPNEDEAEGAPTFSVVEPDSPEASNRLRVGSDWSRALELVTQKAGSDGGNSRILIAGARNAGKSTLLRLTINALLNTHREVLLMDSDLGQGEVRPEGLVSLHRVSRPLIGPPHYHVQLSPTAACYFGANSSQDRPDFYSKCIREVADRALELQSGPNPLPIVINTPGWVKSLGLEALTDLATRIRPTAVLELSANGEPILPSEFDQVRTSLHRFSRADRVGTPTPPGTPAPPQPHRGMTAADARRATMQSYLLAGRPLHASPATALSRARAYRVPFEAVGVHFLHRRRALAPRVLLAGLTGVVVGLASTKGWRHGELPMHPKGELKIIDTLSEPPPCFGIGWIRAVNRDDSSFEIVTPVPHDKLAQVDLLLRGSTVLDSALLYPRYAVGGSPYLVNDSIGLGTSRKSRKNLQRRKHSRSQN